MIDITGYERLYKINKSGKILSLPKKRGRFQQGEKFLKHNTDKDGYKTITLYKNGIQKTYKIHRLVAKEFISNPENKPFINHKNGIKNDNKIKNLEWCTQSENEKHARRTGLKKTSQQTIDTISKQGKKARAFNELQIREIREKVKRPEYNTVSLGRIYGVASSTIGRIARNESYKEIK
jgi:hypothetical protein